MKEDDAYAFSNNNIMKSIISFKIRIIIIIIIVILLPYINMNVSFKERSKNNRVNR